MKTHDAARWWGILGAGGAGMGVLLGAFAAHGLKSHLPSEALAVFETGVRYQFLHALGLILLAAFSATNGAKWRDRAGVAFLSGIFFFSGSLYALTAGRLLGGVGTMHWVVFLTPLGGISFVVGWLFFALSFREESTAKRRAES